MNVGLYGSNVEKLNLVSSFSISLTARFVSALNVPMGGPVCTGISIDKHVAADRLSHSSSLLGAASITLERYQH